MAMRLCEPSVLMATGNGETLAVDGGLFDQQRLAAAGRFHFAVGQLGDFQFRGDGLGNAFEFARLVEGVDEIAKGIESHTPAKLTENPTAGNAEEWLIIRLRGTKLKPLYNKSG